MDNGRIYQVYRPKKKQDEQRERVFFGLFKKLVLRVGDENGPIYLIRYSIFSCPWFAVKLHRILISDDDCLHDHPGSFISIILWGGYVEHTLKSEIGSHFPSTKREKINITGSEPPELVIFTKHVKKLYGPGSVLWRPAPWAHRLEIFQPATTLVITFKKVRTWGFYTKNGWVEWMKYIRAGRPCE
jgi:hypothetical protein